MNIKTLTREQKLRIIKAINDINEELIDRLNQSIETEEFGSSLTADAESSLEKLLEKVGIIIDLDLENLDTSRTKDEIIRTINENNLYDFEELEEVDRWENSERERKYIFRSFVFKYKGTDIYMQFDLQIDKGSNENLGILYVGEVTKKEVVTTEWQQKPII